MKSNIFIILSVSVVIIAAAIAGYYFYNPSILEPKPDEKPELHSDQSSEKLKEFENTLNEFLGSVASNVQIYKNNRKMLISLVQPENIKNISYIEENLTLAAQTIQSLQTQMDKIMGQFSQTDQKINILVQNFDDIGQREILKRWQIQRDENSNKLIAYFESDQEILEAYSDLLQFYAQKRNAMSVDVANKKIMFTNPEDQITADAITDRILKLSVEQRKSLQSE